jgi:hypothetical protein
MNANQIARLMLVTTQSFLRQEIPHAEYVDIVMALRDQAATGGIQEQAKAAYDQMCLDWHALKTA